jgi:AraC-like DNA-binding protein
MDYKDFLTFLLVAGFIQGVTLALVLWNTDSPRRYNNRFLALMLGLLAYRMLASALEYLGISSQQNWLYHFLLEYNWAYGALLFFYVKSYLDSDFKWQQKHWWHFLPVGIELIFSNFVKIQNFYWDGTASSLSPWGYWGYYLWMHTPFQMVIALGLILFYVGMAEDKIESSSHLREAGSRWLNRILKAYRYMSLFILLAGLIEFYFFDYAFSRYSDFPVFITLAIVTYWLGLEGFARRKLPLPLYRIPKKEPEAYHPIQGAVHQIMQEQEAFKNPNLSLPILAAELDIPPYQLTQYLNDIEKKNFNDFVNMYRVEAVKKAFTDPENAHLSLLGIAFDAGFNSKATFNRAVKKATGLTPGALRKKIMEDLAK